MKIPDNILVEYTRAIAFIARTGNYKDFIKYCKLQDKLFQERVKHSNDLDNFTKELDSKRYLWYNTN